MKLVLKNLRRIAVDSGGSQIAEAAFVLPLLFMILLGIMSFGRAFNVYSTITRAAQDGAAVAARSTCGTCPLPNLPATDTQVVTAVNSALGASRIASDQVINYKLAPEPPACPNLTGGCTNGGTSQIRICRNVQLNRTSTGPKQCGAIVSFQYPYHFQIPFASINLTDIQMTAVAEQQMEN